MLLLCADPQVANEMSLWPEIQHATTVFSKTAAGLVPVGCFLYHSDRLWNDKLLRDLFVTLNRPLHAGSGMQEQRKKKLAMFEQMLLV